MKAFPLFILLLLAVPLLEIYLLIQVGGVIGAFPTVLLVVGTAVLGAVLLRVQGLSALTRYRQAMERGELPGQIMLEGLVLLMGGLLLLIPGFFTDALGFICLIPLARQAMVAWLMRRAQTYMQSRDPEQTPGQRVFEGECRELPNDEKK